MPPPSLDPQLAVIEDFHEPGHEGNHAKHAEHESVSKVTFVNDHENDGKDENTLSPAEEMSKHIVPTYEGYVFSVVDPIKPGETASWVRTRKIPIPMSSEKLYSKAVAHEVKSGLNLSGQFQTLGTNQRILVNRLVAGKNAAEKDPLTTWTLFGVKKIYEEQRTMFKTWKVNNAIRVTIRRGGRSEKDQHPVNLRDPTQGSVHDVDPIPPHDETHPQQHTVWAQLPQYHPFSTYDVFDALPEGAIPAPPLHHPREYQPEAPMPPYQPLYHQEHPFRPNPHVFPQSQPSFQDPFEDRLPRYPMVHDNRYRSARRPSFSRPRSQSRRRESVDSDGVCIEENRKEAGMVREEVRETIRQATREASAEDKILRRWRTSKGGGSSRSSRSSGPDSVWSNPATNGTPDTSPERYDPERTAKYFNGRNSSGARPYYMDSRRDYDDRRHDTYRDTGRDIRYPRDRRQRLDHYPTTFRRRSVSRERERQDERPRAPRRITDYPDVFEDVSFNRPGRNLDYERPRPYDRFDRHRHEHREQREEGKRDSNLYVDPITSSSEIVKLPDQTERLRHASQRSIEPDGTFILGATVPEGEEGIPRNSEEHNLHRAEPVFSPESTASISTSLDAKKINEPRGPVDDSGSDHADFLSSLTSLGSRPPATTGLDGDSSIATTTIEMINRIVSILFRNDGLQCVSDAALQDSQIGPEKYRKNIGRMIKIFGSELRTEADSPIQLRAATAMQKRSVWTRVALEILNRADSSCPRQNDNIDYCEPREFMNDDQQSDASIVSADEDEEISADAQGDEAEIRSFILDSKACIQFKKSLLKFVHKPYEERILRVLTSSPTSGTQQDKSSPLRLARELSWVPTDLFSFSHDRSLSFIDNFKGFVEDTMGETWNWSPLETRRHSLRTDCCRLSWTSPDGRTRHADLPNHIETALLEAFRTAPAFTNRLSFYDDNTRPASGTSATRITNSPSPTMPLPSYQTGGRASSTSPAAHQLLLQPLGNSGRIASPMLQSYDPASQSSHAEQYVYLCVEAGRRKFIGIDCNGVLTDVAFFKKIKSEYDSARRWFRLWFSTWQYDHCEFYQFQKTGLGLGARLDIAFPEPSDPLYHYLPKPLDTLQLPPHGPISHDEFHLHYYYEFCPSMFSWERWHRREIGLSLVENGALEVAPKRVVKLDMQNGGREQFYGLYAKEARSAQRVAIYMALCCLPGVIFFFLWLYQWGHGTDLQGASVPVQLSLTLVAGYLGVLYWTR